VPTQLFVLSPPAVFGGPCRTTLPGAQPSQPDPLRHPGVRSRDPVPKPRPVLLAFMVSRSPSAIPASSAGTQHPDQARRTLPPRPPLHPSTISPSLPAVPPHPLHHPRANPPAPHSRPQRPTPPPRLASSALAPRSPFPRHPTRQALTLRPTLCPFGQALILNRQESAPSLPASSCRGTPCGCPCSMRPSPSKGASESFRPVTYALGR